MRTLFEGSQTGCSFRARDASTIKRIFEVGQRVSDSSVIGMTIYSSYLFFLIILFTGMRKTLRDVDFLTCQLCSLRDVASALADRCVELVKVFRLRRCTRVNHLSVMPSLTRRPLTTCASCSRAAFSTPSRLTCKPWYFFLSSWFRCLYLKPLSPSLSLTP